MSSRSALLYAVVVFTVSSCGGSDSQAPRPCGSISCSGNLVCCVGCDDEGLCVQPGQACLGVVCDPEEPLVCDGVECPSQDGSCCIDCDGSSTCVAAGGACLGAACEGVCPSPGEFDQRCESPSDCVVVTYNLDCCGGGNIGAVRSSEMAAFIEAQEPCVAEIRQCPPLGCFTPMVADDGNEVSGPSQVNTVCTDSLCRTVSAL